MKICAFKKKNPLCFICSVLKSHILAMLQGCGSKDGRRYLNKDLMDYCHEMWYFAFGYLVW